MSGFSDTINRIPKGVKNIIFINILFFIATLINEQSMITKFALYPIGSPLFRSYQFITHMFMHGGFAHILFNMYTLYLFGCVLETIWGTKKFIIYYLVTGLGAAACHLFVSYLTMTSARDFFIPTVGASGAVYGLLLAYGMLFPNNRLTLIFPIPINIKAKWLVIIFGGLELLFGILLINGQIAHFAHLGGMLFGLILILIWKKNNRIYTEY